MKFMNLFFRKNIPSAPDAKRLAKSCHGCSSNCFAEPIESMPTEIQDKLEQIRGALIEARSYHVEGKIEPAREKAGEVKRLVRELFSLGEFGSTIDKMFAAHVPETEIQEFIVGA